MRGMKVVLGPCIHLKLYISSRVTPCSSLIPLVWRRIFLPGKLTQDFVRYVRLVHYQGKIRDEIKNEG